MNQYGTVLYFFVLIVIFIMARIALKWIKTADLLRLLCVEYLSQVWIYRARTPVPEEIEAEVDEKLKELEEAK